MIDHEDNVDEHLSEDELAELYDPNIGEGTPDSAPERQVFEIDDDELDQTLDVSGIEDDEACDDGDEALPVPPEI